MYKNCYVRRDPDDYFSYDVHLWTDEGYTVERFQNYGYLECSPAQATHVGLKGEHLKKIYNWQRNDIGLHYTDHTGGNIHTKFLIDKYNLKDLIEMSTTNWSEPEWEFPKGRKNIGENDIECAFREFVEETGYTYNNLVLFRNLTPYEEIFIGSN